MLIELRRELICEHAEAESRMTRVCRLEEHVFAPEEDSDALRVARTPVEKSTAKRKSMTVGTEREMAECDPLNACTCRL